MVSVTRSSKRVVYRWRVDGRDAVSGDFARAGLRRVSFDSLIPYWDRTPLRILTDYLRFSAMARYGQLDTGAVLIK